MYNRFHCDATCIHCLQMSKLEFAGVREQPRMNRINIAIFAMLCCFWPLGLVALLKAIRVSPLYLGQLDIYRPNAIISVIKLANCHRLCLSLFLGIIWRKASEPD